MKHIRGHGLLDDDMSVSYAYGKHAFYNVDSLVDVLMSVGVLGCAPRAELGAAGWIPLAHKHCMHANSTKCAATQPS